LGKQKGTEKELGTSRTAIGRTVQDSTSQPAEKTQMAGSEEKVMDIYERLGWDVDGLI